jgi:hypothetical protein
LSGIARVVPCGLREVLVPFYELFTGPAQQILDRWFESEILKTTLATDAVIGALLSPRQAGSAYVLLHHVMGEAAGRKGVWAYVEGGMGAVSNAIAASAREKGAEIVRFFSCLYQCCVWYRCFLCFTSVVRCFTLGFYSKIYLPSLVSGSPSLFLLSDHHRNNRILSL